jgi:hypothetical protein
MAKRMEKADFPASQIRRHLELPNRHLRRLGARLVGTIGLVAFAQCAFAEQAVDAQRAIEIGRHACSARKTTLVRAAHALRKDWRAEKTQDG